jgi:UDPglucose 6-dehydrogenase
MNRLSVVGLGKLGLPLAVCYAVRGFRVVGVDIDPGKVAAVNDRRVDTWEPKLEMLLRELPPESLTATGDIGRAVADTDATVVIVATPSLPDGDFSLEYVMPACAGIGVALRDKDYHLVMISSTVMPGDTVGPIARTLERASGKGCGEGFGLCYVPEFVALGQIMDDYLNPAFAIVGECDGRSGDMAEAILRGLIGDAPPIARMNLVNAEIVKVASNVMLTFKVGYANLLARLCDAIPGADVDVVTKALALSPRVSPGFMRGGAPFGGPCLPRDVHSLNAALYCYTGREHPLLTALDRANRDIVQDWIEIIEDWLPEGGTVGVLGLSYKSGVPLMLDSPGVWLVEALAERGVDVVAYDPLIDGQAIWFAPSAASLSDCVAKADVVIVVMPWPELKETDAGLWSGKAVIDCWRYFDRPVGAEYIAIGRGT